MIVCVLIINIYALHLPKRFFESQLSNTPYFGSFTFVSAETPGMSYKQGHPEGGMLEAPVYEENNYIDVDAGLHHYRALSPPSH